jgi:uncharacterized membrane protein
MSGLTGVVRPPRRSSWPVPVALLALGLVPILASSARLVELTGGPVLLPARHDPSPIPLVVHLASVIVYAVLGAFQFSSSLRRRRVGWHRAAGRLVVLAGLVVALSALWLTLFFPRSEGGDLLYGFRLLVASAMAASIIVGFQAIRHGHVASHRAWMTRAYALGLGAGTHVFTLGIGQAIVGTSDLSTALLQGSGWAINLAIAEWFIHRQPTHQPEHTVVAPPAIGVFKPARAR